MRAGLRDETYELHGRDWCMQVDHQHCKLRVCDCNPLTVDWSAPEQWDLAHLSGAAAEMEAFVEAIATGGPLKPDLREALQSLVVAEAIAAGGSHDLSPPGTVAAGAI